MGVEPVGGIVGGREWVGRGERVKAGRKIWDFEYGGIADERMEDNGNRMNDVRVGRGKQGR